MKTILIICASVFVWIGGFLNESSFTFPWELSGSCGWDARWSFDESTNTLTISGTGDMDASSPWNKWNDKIYYIVIEDGITSIADKAFYATEALREITIPDSVTSIGKEAFEDSGLTNINLPNSITHMGYKVFAGSDLVEITIPASMAEVPQTGFRDCKNLKKVVLQEGVETIVREAFFGCSALQTVVIPDSVTQIESSAFEDCASLQEIHLSPNIDCISFACFRGCESLREIVIPDKVTKIGTDAFRDCYALEKVTWGNQIEHIDGMAFFDCGKLETLVIPATVKEIGEHVFGEMRSLRAISFLGDCPYKKYTVDLKDIELWYPSDNTTWKYFPENVASVVWKKGCGGKHNFVEVEAMAPSCTDEGHEASVVCQDCGFVATSAKIISAIGHQYGEWTYITPSGTPKKEHKVTRICSVCGLADIKYANEVNPSELPEAPTGSVSDNTSHDLDELNWMWGVIAGVIGVCVCFGVYWIKKRAR